MSKLPDPVPSLRRRIEAIEKQLAARGGGASPFFGTGVHPNGLQGLDSDNYVPATSGFSLNGGEGTAEFKDITLYDLPNSALANPLLPGRLHADAQNFQVKTLWATVASGSLAVPDGYSQALILNLASAATAYNNTAAVDFLYVRTLINGSGFGGWTIGSVDVEGGGGTGVAYDFTTGLLTGLVAGSSLTFAAQVASGYGTWAANGANVLNFDVVLLWLR